MKKQFLSFLTALLCTLFFMSPAWAKKVKGTLAVVKGKVTVTFKKNGKTKKAKVGMKITQGDTIVAEKDSRAKIIMADKNIIHISPGSKLMLEKYATSKKGEKKVLLNVLYGKIRSSVKQKYDGKKSKYQVKTPSAVAGVRGTDFLTGYQPKSQSSTFVTFEGQVAVGTPGPSGSIQNPVTVRPGQMTVAAKGAPPSTPKKMPKSQFASLNKESNTDTAKGQPGDDQRLPANKNQKKEKEEKDDNKEQSQNDGQKAENDDESQAEGDDAQANGEEPQGEGDDAQAGGEEPQGDGDDSQANGEEPQDAGEGEKPDQEQANNEKTSDGPTQNPEGDPNQATNEGPGDPEGGEPNRGPASTNPGEPLPGPEGAGEGSMLVMEDIGADMDTDIGYVIDEPAYDLPGTDYTSLEPIDNIQETINDNEFLNETIREAAGFVELNLTIKTAQ